jgi:LuxR family maltose regulon positive regulatory protein
LPISTLRARGQVTELRAQDLRFTEAEIAAYLENLLEKRLDESTAAALAEKTEGWVTGLRLAILATRGHDDSVGKLLELKGTTAYVMDYLITEVLNAQPPVIRHYLLSTSILDRFSAPLCEVLCGLAVEPGEGEIDGDEFIARLQKENLFQISLDTENRWFRYHHLFQELLQSELKRRYSSEEIATLHSRAVEWFESQGLITESIKHALAAGDVVRAAEIVERYRFDELTVDQWYVVERWLAMLPADIKQERPKLLLTEAWTLYFRLQPSRISLILKRIESLIEGQRADSTLLAEIAFFRGYLHYWQGEAERSLECLEEALSQVVGKEPYVESQLEMHLGLARCMAGQKEQAIRALEDRIRGVASPEGQFFAHIIATLTFMHLICGDLLQARVEAKRMNFVAKKSGISSTEAWSSYMWACTHLHAGDLEKATQHFALAAERRYVLDTMAAVDALAGLALSRQLLLQEEKAAETLDMALKYARETNDPYCLSVAESCRARLSVLRGDLSAAVPWAQSASGMPSAADLFMWLEVPAITRARVMIASGEPKCLEKATELLRAIRQISEACRFMCQTIEVAVLQSLALDKQGRAEGAHKALEEVVALAEPRGWIRPFVEAGPPMADLLKRLIKKNVAVEYIDRLLAAFRDDEYRVVPDASLSQAIQELSVSPQSPRTPVSASADVQPLVEPLTNRELDVLELLVQRMQNKEIAEKLCISPETVKAHLRNIFQKLMVSTRRQAITRAKALGILTRR